MKKIFKYVFAIIFFLGCSILNCTFAEAFSPKSLEVEFGPEYNIFWQNSTATQIGYNKLVLNSNGILNMKFSKPKNYNDYVNLKIYIYDSEGNRIWHSDGNAQKNTNSKYYEYHIGLNSGMYYVAVGLGDYIDYGQQYIYTLYSFSFDETNNIEREINNSKITATRMEKNIEYQGYFDNEQLDIENYDYYNFYIYEGKKYELRFYNFYALYGNTLFRIIEPDGEYNQFGYVGNFSSAPSFYLDNKEFGWGNEYFSYDFTAKRDGLIFISLSNYDSNIYDKQFPYKLEIIEFEDINAYNITSTLDSEYAYTGKEVKPDIKLYDKNKLLKINEDYYVEYENNVNVGRATANIYGIGNYYGSRKIYFNIVDYNATMFKDVKKNDWFYNDIEYVYDNNIIRGYGNGNYGPYDNLTRYMFVVILHRLENEPVVSYKSNFIDVSKNNWYKKAVDWAVQNKIVYGYGDNTFKPNKNITREEFITMLYRYAKYKGVDMSANTDITSYSDYNQIGTYAREAVKWSVSKKIVYGSNNKIKPKDNITRAETAAIIHRYMSKFN